MIGPRRHDVGHAIGHNEFEGNIRVDLDVFGNQPGDDAREGDRRVDAQCSARRHLYRAGEPLSLRELRQNVTVAFVETGADLSEADLDE